MLIRGGAGAGVPAGGHLLRGVAVRLPGGYLQRRFWPVMLCAWAGVLLHQGLMFSLGLFWGALLPDGGWRLWAAGWGHAWPAAPYIPWFWPWGKSEVRHGKSKLKPGGWRFCCYLPLCWACLDSGCMACKFGTPIPTAVWSPPIPPGAGSRPPWGNSDRNGNVLVTNR